MNNKEAKSIIIDLIKKSNLLAICKHDAFILAEDILKNIRYENIVELREEFKQSTGVSPVFANRLPYIKYIEFLESKLTNNE